MKRSLLPVVVLASLSLAACGSSGGGSTTRAGSTKPSATTTPAVEAVDACTLVTARDATRTFHSRAKRSRDASGCGYRSGRRVLSVQVTGNGATASFKGQLGAGQRRFSGPGYTGVARTFILANHTTGTQAGVTFAKGRYLVQIVYTDLSKSSGSLLTSVIAVGRVAAQRLRVNGGGVSTAG